jgi:replication protein
MAPLGINAKSSPAPLRVAPETGEIIPAKSEYDLVSVRVERFALQSVARFILWGSRTSKCLRLRQKHRAEVEVWRSKEHGTASYGGLQTCGSVWACSVCAAKISERRRVELASAIEQHKAAGGDVLLLTLTNPHKLGDSLAEVLGRQAYAMSRFFSLRQGVKLREFIGCVGTIRAWEVTHGRLRPVNNGWHPHFHLLLFVRAGLNLRELRERFYAVWANACRLAGLPVPEYCVPYMKNGKVFTFFGVDVQDGSEASRYASKWGLENEMTKGHVKKALHGETPFDLLRARLMDGDCQAAALFKEFADCFKGRRQLVWSRGLKTRFALADLTDEQLSAVQDDRAFLLGRITPEQWRAILKLDLRADVLELARFGWEPVERLLESLSGVLVNGCSV